MPRPRQGRQPPRLEVGYEAGRGGRDVLGRAYERLLPSSTRPIPAELPTPRKEVRHEIPPPEDRRADPMPVLQAQVQAAA